jgi:hypothetical protein
MLLSALERDRALAIKANPGEVPRDSALRLGRPRRHTGIHSPGAALQTFREEYGIRDTMEG